MVVLEFVRITSQLSMNAVAKLDTYPLPHIDNLFTSIIVRWKILSKLDLAQAYTYNYPWMRLQGNM